MGGSRMRNETSSCLLNTVARRRLNDLEIHKLHTPRVVSIQLCQTAPLDGGLPKDGVGGGQSQHFLTSLAPLKPQLCHSEGRGKPKQCIHPLPCCTPEPPWQVSSLLRAETISPV